MPGRRGVLVAVLVILAASQALGQRRGSKTTPTKALVIELPTAAKFGEVVVLAARYRVSISKHGLSLVNPTTMVTVATLPMLDQASETDVAVPTIEVVEKPGDIIEVIVKSRDRIYTATGIKHEPPQTEPRRIEPAASRDAQLGTVLPKEKSERELIEHALQKRYIRDVKHCADKAHRSRWRTDDRRFWKCVCPLAERWRLAKVKNDLRVHYPLAKGKFGISITVTPKGRVKDCRVWAGAKPPAELEAAPRSQTAADPAATGVKPEQEPAAESAAEPTP